jgi:Putative binding domain, N-terminal
MKRLVPILLTLVLVLPASARRLRTVHHPAPSCSFVLSPVWGGGSVSAAGLTRALVLVFGQTQECSQWAAYSPVDWITVEAAPAAAQPGAFVTVAANPATTSRSATLIIAGVRLTITQDGAARISPPISIPGNLIVNGTFDRDVSGWGWFARYPNGPGAPQWSQFDANANPASGSMLLRDFDQNFDQAFQQLQCIRITPSRTYEFGVKVRSGGKEGEGLIAFLTYPSTDCSGDYIIRNVQSARPAEAGVWQKYDFRQFVSTSRGHSAILLLGTAADVPPFEVWFDDAYVRELN